MLKNQVLVVLEPGMWPAEVSLVRANLPSGLEVISAQDAETAARLLREHLPQLCLLVLGLFMAKDPTAIVELTELQERRKAPYGEFLEVDERSGSLTDPAYLQARFAVDAIDRRVLECCGLGGFEVVEAAAGELGKLPPILYLTVYESAVISARAARVADCVAVLLAPVSPHQFSGAVRELLAESGCIG